MLKITVHVKRHQVKLKWSTRKYLLETRYIQYKIYKRYCDLYNNQINARALIRQSAVGYCAGKPTEKSRVFLIIT